MSASWVEGRGKLGLEFCRVLCEDEGLARLLRASAAAHGQSVRLRAQRRSPPSCRGHSGLLVDGPRVLQVSGVLKYKG